MVISSFVAITMMRKKKRGRRFLSLIFIPVEVRYESKTKMENFNITGNERKKIRKKTERKN